MGRLIAFRPKNSDERLSGVELGNLASEFVGNGASEIDVNSVTSNPDLLSAVIAKLRDAQNQDPASVSEQAADLYRKVSENTVPVGFFDEHDYFLGELALLAGGAFRHLGDFSAAERWFDLADDSFRHTVNPAPLSARVAYARMALRYDRREYERVLEGVPSLIRSFEKLGMYQELQKTRFVEAMSLKEAGRFDRAFECFQALRSTLSQVDSALLSRVLIEIGAEHARNDRFAEAAPIYEEALKHVMAAGEPMSIAHLRATMAETYRNLGSLRVAVECFRSSITSYAEIGMKARVAYLRVVTAETLLLDNRAREAEWEIRAALPVIDQEQLVAEGVAALGLLRESVRRRSVDPSALRDVRELLSSVA